MRVAVVGGGKMGTALIAGFVERLQPRPDVTVVGRSIERVTALAEQYGIRAAELADGIGEADIVVVAVKPYGVVDVVREAAPYLKPGVVVASVAAGVRTTSIEQAAGATARVVRAMPNTPSSIGAGVTAVSAGASCDAEGLALAEQVFRAAGDVIVLPESLQDVAGAVSGSGPAYLFYLAEAMIQAGIAMGMSDATARQAVVRTLRGAALLLDESGVDPSELRAAVTSPNGSTARAIAVFDEHGLKETVAAALAAARARNEEMAQ